MTLALSPLDLQWGALCNDVAAKPNKLTLKTNAAGVTYKKASTMLAWQNR
jgi:hypothetical protein